VRLDRSTALEMKTLIDRPEVSISLFIVCKSCS